MYILKVTKSVYCQIVFVLSLVGGYFLLPNKVIGIMEIAFIATFAISLMCLARNAKENIRLAKIAGKSAIPLILSIVGLSTLEVCSTNLPVCGVNISAGILAAIFPQLLTQFVIRYHSIILFVSLTLQIAYLVRLRCFSRNSCFTTNCS